jgi:uncharacterized protein (TIGR02145 family)
MCYGQLSRSLIFNSQLKNGKWYMKTVWVLLCAFGLVCSCHKEEDVPDAAVAADAMVPNFVGVKGVSGASGTRATDETWTLGDSVGIYMLRKSGDTFDYDLSNAWYKNRKYTVADVANGKLTFAEGHEMYYPVSGDPVAFVAYYPYSSDADDVDTPNTFLFDFTDQDTRTDKEANDFVFHRGTDGYNKSDPDVALEFKHKFSSIKITVKQGTGGPSVKNLDVQLTNMPKSATVDLAALALATDETSINTALGIKQEVAVIKPYVTYNETTKEATVEAFVAPHAGTGAFADRRFIFTTADDKEFTHYLPDADEFKSGHEYNFAFTLKPQDLVNTTPDGMTNCYMVKPNTAVVFPVSRAYTHNGTNFTPTLHTGGTWTGEFDVAVVWEDVTYPIHLINSTATFVTGSGNTAKVRVTANNVSQGGNAVVKICKKGEIDPVWSYHIWVTDYEPIIPDSTWTNPNSTTYTFMDRNLGATEAANSLAGRGLLYQWGRKDPFPGGQPGTAGHAALDSFEGMLDAGSTVAIYVPVATADATGIAAGIVESIERPNAFFTYISSGNDWLPLNKDDLWADGDRKTIYDPCPKGWRVPARLGNSGSSNNKDSPWYGYTNTPSWPEGSETGGANFGTNALYPAAGARGNDRGNFTSGGSYGYYWTATVDGNHAANMYIISDGRVGPSSKHVRTLGQSVRCVKEL